MGRTGEYLKVREDAWLQKLAADCAKAIADTNYAALVGIGQKAGATPQEILYALDDCITLLDGTARKSEPRDTLVGVAKISGLALTGALLGLAPGSFLGGAVGYLAWISRAETPKVESALRAVKAARSWWIEKHPRLMQ